MPIRLTKGNTVFSKKFKKGLSKLSPGIKLAIEEKLAEILTDNIPANIKKLTDYPLGDYRLKIGDYRLLFEWHKKENQFFFLACRHRKDLY